MHLSQPLSVRTPPTLQVRCQRKFLRYYPGGFRDEAFVRRERAASWGAHERWRELLSPGTLRSLLLHERHAEIVRRALTVEESTNLLSSLERGALQAALSSEDEARVFARGLHVLLHGHGSAADRFERWVHLLDCQKRSSARVFNWPMVTLFGFIGQPDRHVFLSPSITRRAAAAYAFNLHYAPYPAPGVYRNLVAFASALRGDLFELRPRDMIDIQAFIRVQGSDEY